MKGATLFSGGGGVEARLTDIIDFRHAVEYDAQIAAVYAQNIGAHVQVARVEDVDYSLWGALDYLHASPVCKEYSAAKTGGAEGEGDIQSALAVVRCLEATQPRVFTLENVGAYQHGKAYRLICQALDRGGYMWHAEVLNSADFGVPQTRRRLILRAVRDRLLPTLPEAVPWVGWYAAIEDLIPTLPRKAMPPRLNYVPVGVLVDQLNASNETQRPIDEPCFTVSCYSTKHPSPRLRLASGDYATDPQACARFQTLPRSYRLPDDISLAGVIVGNAVPSLMMRRIVEQLI